MFLFTYEKTDAETLDCGVKIKAIPQRRIIPRFLKIYYLKTFILRFFCVQQEIELRGFSAKRRLDHAQGCSLFSSDLQLFKRELIFAIFVKKSFFHFCCRRFGTQGHAVRSECQRS
jgi:hypothetical protein